MAPELGCQRKFERFGNTRERAVVRGRTETTDGDYEVRGEFERIA